MNLAQAVVQLVRNAVPAVTVYDGRVPTEPPERYVVVYVDTGRLAAETVEHLSTSTTLRWQVTSVAPDREMAAWLATRARDALVDTRPTADGYAPGLVEHILSRPAARDEQVLERPAVFAVDLYALAAEKLPAAV